MKQLMSLGLSIGLLLGLSACGNKGPLYLPDQAKQTTSATDKVPQKQQIEKKQ